MTHTEPTPTENRRRDGQASAPGMDDQLVDVLARFPGVVPAVLFGSVALGRQRSDSDLDIAVAAHQALTAAEKMAIVEALAERTGRPVDLVDLKVVTEPLLGQIVRHGRRLLGSDSCVRSTDQPPLVRAGGLHAVPLPGVGAKAGGMDREVIEQLHLKPTKSIDATRSPPVRSAGARQRAILCRAAARRATCST